MPSLGGSIGTPSTLPGQTPTPGPTPSLAPFLITAGAGLVLAGVGTLFSNGLQRGGGTTLRNPTAPRNVIYGRARVGGTLVYVNTFGDSDKYMDMVIVLADHPCNNVDELLFDQQRVQLGNPSDTTPYGWWKQSFTPLQQDIAINSIERVGNVVTVNLHHDIPLLSDGDQVLIQNVHPVSAALNGKFPVTILNRTGGITFTYLSGGTAISIPSFPGSETGDCKTTWPDYKAKIYMEVMLGSQPLGQTFAGMINGTPYDGDTGDLQTFDSNPWTPDCSLVGTTCVFIRLHFNDQIFANGLPQISFHVSGKNDIRDPRASPPTVGYSENAALCIADYLSNTTFGFKAVYGTEIPYAPLIAAANICDEAVTLAEGGTEPRYACNGGFTLAVKRSEVLQNMLTSCAGRLTYTGGQFIIWPAAWGGVSTTLTNAWMLSNASGPIRWRPTVSISNLYNGVKGTYVSPVNNWQPSDFPYYAQDAKHGYNDGPPDLNYDANLAADGGDRRWKDVQLPFTISCPTAQRIAKIELLRSRQQGTGTFAFNMAGYQFSPLDILGISLDYFGWDAKNLEVLAARFRMDRRGEDATLLGTEIDVQESDSSVYFWSDAEELSPAGYQQVTDPALLVPDPPSNLMITFDDQGRVILKWTAPIDAYVTLIEGRYQLIASPPGLWISLGTVNFSVTQLVLPKLDPGSQYLLELRSLNGAGIPSDWVSIVYTPIALPPEWAPYQIQADAADALFPSEWTFDVAPDYETAADGPAIARLIVTGKFPVNSFIPGSTAPAFTFDGITQVTTGGSLAGGSNVRVAICGFDANNVPTPPSFIAIVPIPTGTNTNKFTITGISWPTIAGLTKYVVFASVEDDLICAQLIDTLTDTGGGVYTPTSIDVLGPFARSTWALPDPATQFVRIQAKRLIHGGVLGAPVDSVSTNTIVAGQTIDLGSPPTDDWTGRVLWIIGRALGSAPYAAFNITAFDRSTGTFTLDRDPVGAGVLVDDVFVVCTKGYDNSSNPLQIQDTGGRNGLNFDIDTYESTPHSGLKTDQDKGYVIRVIKGTNRGATARIVGNDADTYTLDAPVIIAADSVWIVEENGWPYAIDSTAVPNADLALETSIALPLSNALRQSYLVGGFTVDDSANESGDADAPIRPIYVSGANNVRSDS